MMSLDVQFELVSHTAHVVSGHQRAVGSLVSDQLTVVGRRPVLLPVDAHGRAVREALHAAAAQLAGDGHGEVRRELPEIRRTVARLLGLRALAALDAAVDDVGSKTKAR